MTEQTEAASEAETKAEGEETAVEETEQKEASLEEETAPDAVLSQMAFSGSSSDVTWSDASSELDANGYFIPHRMLFADFIRCGFPADKLYATGIPVRPRFYAAHPDRMALRRELELPENGKRYPRALTCI